ncbi:SAM-dependent methyltransferase [Neptunicella marina]|uniref:Class I SAM-dependent methyltransferase n=1 Tax=Neptunicella marina TaxID=2125989 RepID=A0A8J6IRU5_9ALTE|nr:cyclopropane-fatty-acyl-phospholipid synthase family protein [Neptunicella marina]MBC3764426.1 class I SAM-dependent methyltransferase [Neptunicella marina]
MANSDISLTSSKSSNSFVQSVSRKLVFAKLNALRFGQLTVKEGSEKFQFGSVQSDYPHLVAEIDVADNNFYVEVMLGGSIGAAESYMSGDWRSPNLVALVELLVANSDALDGLEKITALFTQPLARLLHWYRRNTPKGSRRNIAAHYDLGNEFFSLFLDPTMMYSAGIFPHENATMQQASEHKLKVICDKLELSEEDHLLEIGTGWGAMAIYAAKHYGCKVTTTTISQQQYLHAKQWVEREGLTDRITLLQSDYRDLQGQFDKLVSVEMIEAIGWRYLPVFFKRCHQLIKPGGLMLLQSITIAEQRYEKAKFRVDFIQKYIFPGGFLPSVQALLTAMRDASDFRLVNQQDYAEHYARTLACWEQAFHVNRDKIKALGFNDEFMRMWHFYLAYCQGGFNQRSIGVSHVLMARPFVA